MISPSTIAMSAAEKPAEYVFVSRSALGSIMTKFTVISKLTYELLYSARRYGGMPYSACSPVCT